ncbi:MAG: acyl-CoA dehydrogenase [Deltaproteobacteria bacterium RIFOXYA12_FULL_61_11]|nr:MAG: acyl-CoA dehydrogenase [Deltaproteobacteria bacterium RIFOXYA12_FULL_61_11]
MTEPITHLTEDEEFLRQSIEKFAKNDVAPRCHAMDEQQAMDPALIKQCFDLGLMGIEVPERFGGTGSSFFSAVLAIEELAKVDASLAVLVDVQNTLVDNCILRWGTEAQQERYLPQLCTQKLGAYALSEGTSGSDAFALKTRATKKGDRFLLSGSKLWITNAKEAEIFIVFANADPEAGYRGITSFIVEKDFPGFSIGKKEDKLGIRASSTCELLFENCEVPAENVLGEVGQGYKVAIETLNEGRIGISGQMVGVAEGAFACALGYAKERAQFGKPIATFQGMQMLLAELAVNIEAAKTMTYNAARLKDAGLPFVKEAAMAKFFTSQVAERVASKAVEIYGGAGFTKEYPVEKFYRDAKIGSIYEGTSFMQLLTIAKILLAG